MGLTLLWHSLHSFGHRFASEILGEEYWIPARRQIREVIQIREDIMRTSRGRRASFGHRRGIHIAFRTNARHRAPLSLIARGLLTLTTTSVVILVVASNTWAASTAARKPLTSWVRPHFHCSGVNVSPSDNLQHLIDGRWRRDNVLSFAWRLPPHGAVVA